MKMVPMKQRRTTLRSIAVPAALTALAAATLSACGSAAPDDGKLKVVASFYPMAYLAQQIGGSQVHVTNLTKPGVEPHDLELAPPQVGEIADADLAVYLKGLQPAVDEAIAQNKPKRVVDATKYAPLEQHGSEVDGEHGGEHGEDDGHDHGEEHAEDDGHDHAGGDPHIWLDPVRYARVAEGVGTQLAKADPKHRAEYRKNTAALVARLGRLNQDFKQDLTTCRTRAFVTSHAAFGYLAERYRLDEIAISGVDPDAEPSPKKLREIQSEVREHKVNTIFFETLASPKLAKTLAGDLNLKTAVLDPLEGVKDPKKDNYFSIMRDTNLANLRTAMGCS
jgi:zinc transport system substrate-binding protein